jgi:hypothetical protein
MNQEKKLAHSQIKRIEKMYLKVCVKKKNPTS